MPKTWIVVGLGNPGSEYEDTRHNVGFRVLDLLASEYRFRFKGPRHEARFAESDAPRGSRDSVVWIKPQTYMNLSGRSVRSFVEEHDARPENVIVVVDDLDLDLGRIRIREKGSTGGHRGLESIAQLLRSKDYVRVRVGIGRPPGRKDAADWVLEPFGRDEKVEADIAEVTARDAVTACITDGVVAAMNVFNRAPSEASDG